LIIAHRIVSVLCQHQIIHCPALKECFCRKFFGFVGQFMLPHDGSDSIKAIFFFRNQILDENITV